MKTPTVSKLKKELDMWFSRFIRIRDEGVCFTCGLVRHWKEMHNGHYVPRQFNSTRYDERNNNCQCYACNMLYNGQPDIYTLRLKEKYGDGIIEDLNKLRREIKQWSIPELQKLIIKYKNAVEEAIHKQEIS